MLAGCSFLRQVLSRRVSLTWTIASPLLTGCLPGRRSRRFAAAVGKSFQTIYREISRNSEPGGRYQPRWAHNQALRGRQRPRRAKLEADVGLRELVRAKLECKWSPQQISRFLGRAYPRRAAKRLCTQTIYRALFPVWDVGYGRGLSAGPPIPWRSLASARS
jgi:IS30 family transposase